MRDTAAACSLVFLSNAASSCWRAWATSNSSRKGSKKAHHGSIDECGVKQPI